MLQFETLPPSFAALLQALGPCFTAPTFRTFAVLVAGMIAQPGRHTVTGMLSAAGLAGVWHHAKAHWFFSGARWCADTLGMAVLALIVDQLLPADAAVLIAVDDTLFRRSGRTVYGTGWWHDGAATSKRKDATGWGNRWVIAAIVLWLPFTDRPVALPVAFALCTKIGPTQQVLAGRLVTRIAAAYPHRQIDVVADAWYASAAGPAGATVGKTRQRAFPTDVTLTSRLRANACLNAIAQPIPGARGRPRRIGPRLGKPADLAATATFTPTTVRRYGRTDTVHTAEITCLWYGAYRSQAVRVILVRDPDSKTTTGYDLALVTTDLTTPAAGIAARYAARWSIETMIEDAKQTTGVGQARNRTPNAVTRTVPFALITQSLTVYWYTLHGHHRDAVTQRRTAAPWYTTKTSPSYQDMTITLRRTLIAARFRADKPAKPTPQETQAVLLAWAQAAA
jgi:hypothetical protein